MPLLPEAEYREMLADADVALIAQQPPFAFFPSKLLNALAASRPIVAVADDDSELARVVRDAACGARVATQRPEELAGVLQGACAEESGSASGVGASWTKLGRPV